MKRGRPKLEVVPPAASGGEVKRWRPSPNDDSYILPLFVFMFSEFRSVPSGLFRSLPVGGASLITET